MNSPSLHKKKNVVTISEESSPRRAFCQPKLTASQFSCAVLNYFFRVDPKIPVTEQCNVTAEHTCTTRKVLSTLLEKPIEFSAQQPQFIVEGENNISVHQALLACKIEHIVALSQYIHSIGTIGASLVMPAISPGELEMAQRSAENSTKRKASPKSSHITYETLQAEQFSTLLTSILPEALLRFTQQERCITQAALIAEACSTLLAQNVPCTYLYNYFADLSGTHRSSLPAQGEKIVASIQHSSHLKGLPYFFPIERHLGRTTAPLISITQDQLTELAAPMIEQIAVKNLTAGLPYPKQVTFSTSEVETASVDGQRKIIKQTIAKLAANTHPITVGDFRRFLTDELAIAPCDFTTRQLVSALMNRLRTWQISGNAISAKRSQEVFPWGAHPNALMATVLRRWLETQLKYIGFNRNGDVRREDKGIFPTIQQSQQTLGNPPAYGYGYQGMRGAVLLGERLFGDTTLRDYYYILSADEVVRDLSGNDKETAKTSYLQIFYDISADTKGNRSIRSLPYSRQKLFTDATQGLHTCHRLIGKKIASLIPDHLQLDERLVVLGAFAPNASLPKEVYANLCEAIPSVLSSSSISSLSNDQATRIAFLLISITRKIEEIPEQSLRLAARSIAKVLITTYAATFTTAALHYGQLPDELIPYREDMGRHIERVAKSFKISSSPKSLAQITQLLHLSILLKSQAAFEPFKATAFSIVTSHDGPMLYSLIDRSEHDRIFRICWTALTIFAPAEFQSLREQKLTQALQSVTAQQGSLDVVCSYAFPAKEMDPIQEMLVEMQIDQGNYPTESWHHAAREILFGRAFTKAITSPQRFLNAMHHRYGEPHERAAAVMALSVEARTAIIKALPNLSVSRHLPFFTQKGILDFTAGLSEEDRYLFVSRGFYDAYALNTTTIKKLDFSDELQLVDNPFYVLGIPCKVDAKNETELSQTILASAIASRKILQRIFHSDQFGDVAAKAAAEQRVKVVDAAFGSIESPEKLLRFLARLRKEGFWAQDSIAPRKPWYAELQDYFSRIKKVTESAIQESKIIKEKAPKRTSPAQLEEFTQST